MHCLQYRKSGCVAREKKTTKRTSEEIHFAVVVDKEGLAMRKRDTEGIWAGLYEFPRLEKPPINGLPALEQIVHKLSHKDLICHFWKVTKMRLTSH